MGQIGLVLGVVGLFGTLLVPRRLILLHGGVMIASLPVLALVGRDGSITRAEGALLFASYAVYFLLLLRDRSGESEFDGVSVQPLYKAIPFVAIGLATVIVGAELTVRSVTQVALDFQVDPAIVAIVIVGVGTSLPELSISLGAIVRNRVRMSIGNLIGSNIFDTLVPIGAASAIAGLDFDEAMLRVDLPFLALLSLVALVFLLRRRGLRRLDALLLLALYIAYVAVRLGRA
jgi:cation:H+ antiporter